ncbi:flavin reductase family protein [Aliikangiella sp. G2MR2-5]|uniref:flavin reductase family protein n=1 Tax=Aliikangiella sp. G2MR2-5 TaxID=2788943 RepID=UPI0018A9563E|nr:flavin reductase family protein [Aliikangiella sp. G2MR2-5]
MCRHLSLPENKIRYRNTLSHFPTGVAIVTCCTPEGDPVGMTINSFCSISLTPALVGWCIDRKANSYLHFARAREFSITFLSATQEAIAQRFATRGADKFQDIFCIPHIPPVIQGGTAWLQCTTDRTLLVGDHLMIIGQVFDFEQSNRRPLVFSEGKFNQLSHHLNQAA